MLTRLHRRRIVFAAFSLASLALATFLVLRAFNENLMFYFTPTEITEGKAPVNHTFRAGGIVKEGSIVREGLDVRFQISDMNTAIPVSYTGILPDLFRDGQEVIVRGQIDESGLFAAQEVLAKHDEHYVPREIEQMMREQKAAGAEMPPDHP